MSVIRKKARRRSLKRKEKPLWEGHGYQREAVGRGFKQKFLAYFLDPGLGKTTIILSLLKMLLMYRKTKGVLIIAPIRVMHLVWPLEVQKWRNFDDLKVNVMHGDKKDLWSNLDADIHIINPAGLPWLVKQLKGKRVANWPFDMLVVDESTMFKTYSSQRFKLLRNYFVAKMKRRYILTGTPIPNGYIQLFSQFQIVDEGFSLGTGIGQYRDLYFRLKPYTDPKHQQYELLPGHGEKINQKIARFVCRMSAEEYLTLPPITINTIHVEMPPKAKKIYGNLEKDEFVTIKGKDVYPPTAASLGQKLHQICNGNLYEDWDVLTQGQVPSSKNRPYHKLHTAKIDALKELIAELQGKPLFIGYWYHHDLQTLKDAFPDLVVLNSKTSDKEALRIENKWNAGKIQLLAAQPASVAHGLNFQKAGGDVCWYSLVYDFELYDQFIKRLWRQGAFKNVVVHFLMMLDTIDDAIFEKLMAKKVCQDDFYDVMTRYQRLRKRRRRR